MTLKRAQILRLISEHLSTTTPALEIHFEAARKRRRVPGLTRLGWGPDFTIQRGRETYLIHVLSGPEVPARVKRSITVLRRYRTTHIIIVAVSTRDFRAHKIAEEVCENCATAGLALLCESTYGLVTVLPPKRLTHLPCGHPTTEIGHLPKWVLGRLVTCESFSPYLRRQIKSLVERYGRLTARRRLRMYDQEADLLEDFLRKVRRGATSFYLPLERFLELKAWERQGGHQGARDHYFHTFNNLLLGLLILGEMFADRAYDIPPDSFVADAALLGRLKPWEALWFLTCLNHDPGYIGEKFWGAIYAKFGLLHGSGKKRSIPADVAEELTNGWETDLKRARVDLLSLYERVANVWLPPQLRGSTVAPFDSALQIAYFDGERSSHSLLSGLTLIQGFVQDETQKQRGNDEYIRCLAGCEVAALSMLFHDQRCRELLEEHKVPPIPFEQLPYASLLIFVDALQDDRRDIKVDVWPQHGVLNGLQVLNEGAVVNATVCLREIPVKYWPSKLIEYDSALRWLNASARITFRITFKPSVDF